MKKKPSKKKRNPQDSTRRNIVASRRRDAQLLQKIVKLELWVEGHFRVLCDRISKLEGRK